MSKQPGNKRSIALAAILSLPLIWGTTFAVVQRALIDVSPMAFVVLRFTIASAIFLIISKSARRGVVMLFRPSNGIERRFRRDTIILGASIGGGYIFQTIGLLTTTSSKSAFLTSTTIIWTPLLSVALGRERMTTKILIAVGITLAGIILLTHPFGMKGILVGDILSVGCAMSFAVYIAWVDIAMPRARKLADNDHDAAMLITSTQLVAATILFIILLPVLETPRVLFTTYSVSALVYTAIAATTLTAYLQSRFQHNMTPTTASVIYMLEPVVAMFIAYLFLKEQMGFDELLGGGLIILGVIIAQMNFGSKTSLKASNT